MSAAIAVKIRDIPLPRHMAGRPVDRRGFPVPYFVAWLSPAGERLPDGMGEPDHRVVDQAKLARCLKFSLCWLCGQPLTKFKALVGGPMCLVTRSNADPDCHVECAEYAAQACPFLANERARRNTGRELPPGIVTNPAGHPRNPGVVFVFVHTERWLKRLPQGPGLAPLFGIPPGEPRRLLFFANGERATRPQVMASLNSGLVILQDQTTPQGKEALTALACYYAATVALVERWTDDFDAVNDDEAKSIPARL